LRAVDRANERADVDAQGEVARVVEVRQFRAAWMQSVGVSVAGRVDGLKRGAVEREYAARALVLRVCRGVGGDDEVVRIVSAEQEQADQRLVIGDGAGRLRDGGV